MANKIMIVILALLVIISGGIGYYSYTLNQQIDLLGERLTSFETEQTASFEVLRDELKQEIQSGLGRREAQVVEVLTDIDA